MEQLEKIQRLLAKPACRMIVGGFRPSSDPFASWFGKVSIAQAHEAWPLFQGEPMMPLCQINCTELPMRSEALIHVDFLTLFIAADKLPVDDTANGEGWALRTYKNDQSLTLLEQPTTLKSSTKAFPVRWEMIPQDYPSWKDALDILKENDLSLFDDHQNLFPNHYCSKLGGWPSHIQSRPFDYFTDKPTYVFQIDSEYKAHWSWGDNGIGYFGCLPKGDGQWFLDWQQF